MKGIFERMYLWPFDKKLIFELVMHANTRNFTVSKVHTYKFQFWNRLSTLLVFYLIYHIWMTPKRELETEMALLYNNHQQLWVNRRKAQENMLTAVRPIGHARIDIWNGFSSRPLTSTQMMRERSTQNSYDWERRRRWAIKSISFMVSPFQISCKPIFGNIWCKLLVRSVTKLAELWLIN